MGKKVMFMIRNALGDVITEEVRKQFTVLDNLVSQGLSTRGTVC